MADSPSRTYDSNSVKTAVTGADLVIVCLGTGNSIESEGNDRADIELPGKQFQLLQDAVSYSSTFVCVGRGGGGVHTYSISLCMPVCGCPCVCRHVWVLYVCLPMYILYVCANVNCKGRRSLCFLVSAQL